MKTTNQNSYKTNQSGSYNELLKSPQWIKKRRVILKRDNNCCQHCSKKLKLQVHHRQYQFDKNIMAFVKPWEYHDKYLVTLCELCHETGHKIYKVPVININN